MQSTTNESFPKLSKAELKLRFREASGDYKSNAAE